MKKSGFVKEMKRCGLILMTGIVLLAVMNSCRKDDNDIVINEPDYDAPEHDGMVLFLYTSGNPGYMKVCKAGSSLESTIYEGDGFGMWENVSGVQSGVNQYVVCHPNLLLPTLPGKEFSIRKIEPGGYIGAETDHHTWNNYYETFFGFQLGNRGFIFGLRSGASDKIWFTQEVYPNGTLAPDEAANGTWDNYYNHATPIYSNGQTYLYFQNPNSKYWFITHVADDGSLHDVCDGHWANEYDVVTSVETGDNSYLFGEKTNDSYWFIQRMDFNGVLGEETDRNTWNYNYDVVKGYTLFNQAYLFGAKGSGDFNKYYFIQEVTNDGILGAETSSGWLEHAPDFAVPFKLYEKPDSFRYMVGWNMSQTDGSPETWSLRNDDPWGGYFKMGGGAALANIDGDPGQMQDALLMGIEDRKGGDRFYYKIAWNLNIFGDPTSMSNTIFGPVIGESQAGAGADICDIDSNQVPDLIFMVVDDPEGPNAFWYYIGYNVNHQGVPTNWSDKIQVSGLGDSNQGGGAAVGLIDNNPRPDIVFVGIDNPWQDNTIWMVIGKNINWFGLAESWTPKIILPCDIGWSSAGGGAALADINKNGHPDLLLMNIDSPTGPNGLWSWVGWDIDINGNVASWSAISSRPSLGNITSGGGAAIGDIDLNGTPDLFLMTIDNPYGND